jgi:hypothetical protein
MNNTNHRQDRSEMSDDNTPPDFQMVDLNTFPPLHAYPRPYWYLGMPDKQIAYLLDQNRLDDAVIFFLYAVGACFPEEIPFLHSLPDCAEIVGSLRKEGRVKFFNEGLRHRYRTTELVLGPNSGIESILRDVELLLDGGS